MANAKAMDDAEVEAELEKAKEAQLKTHQAGVEKAKKRAEQFEIKLKPLNDEHAALTKQLSKSKKDEEKTRIKTDLETLERSIAGVESDLAKAVQESEAPFVFKPPKEKTGKKKTAGHLFVSKKDGQLLPLTVPSEDLPETGTLYVADNERCLGIVRWSELELAQRGEASQSEHCRHGGYIMKEERIVVTIDANGTMTAKTTGIKGERCIEELEALLSELAELDEIQHTREYKEKDAQSRSITATSTSWRWKPMSGVWREQSVPMTTESVHSSL